MDQIKPVKTAIVGCGMISNIYIRNLKNLFSIIDLMALCDVRRENAEEKAKIYGIAEVMTMEELAESRDIELVINLTSPDAHYVVIKKMLESGKHVFSEKTLAVSFEEGRELAELAKKKGLYLGAAPDTVLGAGLQTARKVIDAGLIGTVTSCFASINRNQPLNSESFRFIQKGAGGAFPMDVGVYYAAALLSLLGPAECVSGFATQAPLHEKELLFMEGNRESWQLEGSNLMTGAVKFKSGALGVLHFNGLSINREMPMISIYGTEGILEVGDPNTFNGEVRLLREKGEACVIPFTNGYDGKTAGEMTEFEKMYGHRGVGAAEMAWAISRGRPNRCSKEFALHTLEVLCGIDRASASGENYRMTTEFTFVPLKAGYYSTTFGDGMRADAERSLVE